MLGRNSINLTGTDAASGAELWRHFRLAMKWGAASRLPQNPLLFAGRLIGLPILAISHSHKVSSMHRAQPYGAGRQPLLQIEFWRAYPLQRQIFSVVQIKHVRKNSVSIICRRLHFFQGGIIERAN